MLDTAPPLVADAPAEAAPARRRFPFRFPKAVLVTALTFALSAWLVPAMTRQWDDRQKEHELKAGVVSDMSSQTARALVGGEAIWSHAKLTDADRQRMSDEWALAALGMEARLRTYFPASVVQSWELYSWAVDRFIEGGSVSAGAGLGDVVDGRPLDPAVRVAAAHLVALSENHKEPKAPNFGIDKSSATPQSDAENIPLLRKALQPDLGRDESGPFVWAKWTAVEKQLLALEQAVADQVLRSHATGFSTTGRDLMHDLLP